MIRIILLATALFISGCASKDKAMDSKKMAKNPVKTSAKEKDMTKKSATPISAVSETIESITCSYNNDNRKISSVKLNNGGCEVYYEKFGERTVVATAKFDLGYCSQMANKVSNNLEEAGFTCK